MLLVVPLLVALAAGVAEAHPLAPSVLELQEDARGHVDVRWRFARPRPRGAHPHPQLPLHCRTQNTVREESTPDATVLHWQADCGPHGLAGHALEVTALASPLTVVVRVQLPDGRMADGVLTADSPRFVVPLAPSWRSVARGYLRLGLVHIATGPDHLLFVFGLVLLARTWRHVLATVTAFTIGHSLTLVLATLGLIVLPSGPIEFAIAVSVLAVAIQVAGSDAGSPQTPLGRPWLMAGAFGLLHGLGFAAVLREVGLPAGAIPLALLAFNVGIEIGQVAFVLVLLALGTLVRRHLPGLGRSALRAPAYVMGTLAAYWCFVRAAEWLHA